MTETATPLETEIVAGREVTGGAALAGGAAAGLALGLTELIAGLFEGVPSAIASIGTVIIDWSPPFIVDQAIGIFGTADKGALAIGTGIVAVLLGMLVGRLASASPRIVPLAFGAAGVVGVATALDQPGANAAATIIALGLAVAVGIGLLRWMLGRLRLVQYPTDGVSGDIERRRFLATVFGAGAAGAVAAFGGRGLIIRRSEETRMAMAFPTPVTLLGPPVPQSSFAIAGLDEIIVPNRDFYRIDTALTVPRPNPETWRLRVGGFVDRPIEMSMDDLLAMDLHEQYVTIACVSNEVGGSLVGNAKWTGVRLSEVLERAGVQSGATQVASRSVDGWTAGFPTEVVFDGREPLIAIGMNDEPLPPSHGFPARLIVPGLYGYVSATKWLEEIELTTLEAFEGFWIPRGWSKFGPIKTQSRIDVPRTSELVDGAATVLAGVAWAPLKGIDRVEVRIDAGEWVEAELSAPLSEKAWVQWRLETSLEPGAHSAEVRATDGTGATQTEAVSSPRPDGATGWHRVGFRTS